MEFWISYVFCSLRPRTGRGFGIAYMYLQKTPIGSRPDNAETTGSMSKHWVDTCLEKTRGNSPFKRSSIPPNHYSHFKKELSDR